MESLNFTCKAALAIPALVVALLIGGFPSNTVRASGADYQQLHQQLDTGNQMQARHTLDQLGQLEGPRVDDLLADLWGNGPVRRSLAHRHMYDDPIVRLMLAEKIVERGARDSSAAVEYIRKKAGHEQWDVRRFAADALGIVGDKKAVDKLTELVRNDTTAVARAAVYGLQKIAVSGQERALAIKRLRDLLKARGTVDDDVAKLLRDVNRGFPAAQANASALSVPFADIHGQIVRMIASKEYDNALDTLRPYADGGNVIAQYLTATVYLLLAANNDTDNISSAVLWLQRAEKAGYPPAAFELGRMYLYGRGVIQNSAKGLQLLKAAESAGYGPARQELQNARAVGFVSRIRQGRLGRLMCRRHVLPPLVGTSVVIISMSSLRQGAKNRVDAVRGAMHRIGIGVLRARRRRRNNVIGRGRAVPWASTALWTVEDIVHLTTPPCGPTLFCYRKLMQR